jgi:hypothetical protein
MNRKNVRSRAGRQLFYTVPAAILLMFAETGPGRAQAVHGTPIGPATNSPPAATVRGEPIAQANAPSAGPAETNRAANPEKAKAVPDAGKTAEAWPDVGFDVLGSYEFEVSDHPVMTRAPGPDVEDAKIPDQVRAYDQKKVQIKGFMVPLETKGDKATEFMILKDPQMCCFGIVPRINEWVTVKTADKGVPIIMDEAVAVQGVMHVGVIRDSSGYVSGVYRMDGEKLVGK